MVERVSVSQDLTSYPLLFSIHFFLLSLLLEVGLVVPVVDDRAVQLPGGLLTHGLTLLRVVVKLQHPLAGDDKIMTATQNFKSKDLCLFFVCGRGPKA